MEGGKDGACPAATAHSDKYDRAAATPQGRGEGGIDLPPAPAQRSAGAQRPRGWAPPWGDQARRPPRLCAAAQMCIAQLLHPWVPPRRWASSSPPSEVLENAGGHGAARCGVMGVISPDPVPGAAAGMGCGCTPRTSTRGWGAAGGAVCAQPGSNQSCALSSDNLLCFSLV